MVAGAYERLSLTRGSKYSVLTWKLLVIWKTDHWGGVVAAGGLIVYNVKVSFFRGNFILQERKEAAFPRQKNRVERKFRNFSFSNEILWNRVATISKPFSTVQKLNRVAYNQHLLCLLTLLWFRKKKNHKLAFNLISSPDNASVNFSRVFNFDFFFLQTWRFSQKNKSSENEQQNNCSS